MKVCRLLAGAAVVCLAAGSALGAPKMIAYSAQPNAYFDEHAAEAAKLYDGFFFVVGSWDKGVTNCLGVPGEPQSDSSADWRKKAGSNLKHLTAAGATESLLGTYYEEDGAWPSPETLRDAAFTEKMAKHFGALGQAAKDLGFRGVCIDIEYPYKRYSLENPIYKYDGYTADDLVAAAATQGRACMAALLDAFPEAVIWFLPGDIGGPPIIRAYTNAALEVMAERDAPGGCHLGYERSYCMCDPASQVAIPRVGDCMAEIELTGRALDYWKRRCTVAPGVWPLHKVETGGQNYPNHPWTEELADLRQQMAIMRATAKRYIWSFTAHPVWCAPEQTKNYGINLEFEGAAEAVSGWQRILAEKTDVTEPRIKKLLDTVSAYDRGEIDGAGFCSRFGTPPDYMVLGFLSNPFTNPAYAAPNAYARPIVLDKPIQGRDGVVRWFRFQNREPVGSVRLRAAFDNRNTNDCSVQLVCTVRAEKETKGYLWFNRDDGAIVRLNGNVVLDRSSYPEKGHGLQYQDRYWFEEHVPVTVPKGENLLAITSYNSHGSWGVNLRIADEDGYPLDGISFGLPPTH